MTPGICIYPRQKLSTLSGWTAQGGDIYRYRLLNQFVDSAFQDLTALIQVSTMGALDYGKFYIQYDSGDVYIYIKNTVNPNYQNYFIYVVYRRYFAQKEFDITISEIMIPVIPVVIDAGTITRSVSRMGGTIELGMHSATFASAISGITALELKNERVEVVDLETMSILYRGFISETNYSAVSNVLSITSESGMTQRKLIEKPTVLGNCIVEPEKQNDPGSYAIFGSKYEFLGPVLLALYDDETELTPGIDYYYVTTPDYPFLYSITILADVKGKITAKVNSVFKGYNFDTGLKTLINSSNIADYLYYFFNEIMGETCNLPSFKLLQSAGYTTNKLVTPDTDIETVINSLLVSTLCYAVRDNIFFVELKIHNRATSPELYIPFENVTNWVKRTDTANYADIITIKNDQTIADLKFTLGPGKKTKDVPMSLDSGAAGASWSIANLVFTSGEQFEISGIVNISPLAPGKKIWMTVDGANYFMITERIQFDLNNQMQTLYCGKDYAPESGGVLSPDGVAAITPDGLGMIAV